MISKEKRGGWGVKTRTFTFALLSDVRIIAVIAKLGAGGGGEGAGTRPFGRLPPAIIFPEFHAKKCITALG